MCVFRCRVPSHLCSPKLQEQWRTMIRQACGSQSGKKILSCLFHTHTRNPPVCARNRGQGPGNIKEETLFKMLVKKVGYPLRQCVLPCYHRLWIFNELLTTHVRFLYPVFFHPSYFFFKKEKKRGRVDCTDCCRSFTATVSLPPRCFWR